MRRGCSSRTGVRTRSASRDVSAIGSPVSSGPTTCSSTSTRIPFGVDFRQHIDRMVADCDVVLVVIGRRWVDAVDEHGQRRLDQAGDFVRLEVEAALRREIPVVPLLVDGATIPQPSQLPESLADLAYRNGTQVRHDPDFHPDIDRLLRRLAPAPPAPASPQTADASLPTGGAAGHTVRREPASPRPRAVRPERPHRLCVAGVRWRPTAPGSCPPPPTRRCGSGMSPPATTRRTLKGHTERGVRVCGGTRRHLDRVRLQRQDVADLGCRHRRPRVTP